MNDIFEDDLKNMKVEELKREIPWPPETLSTKNFRPYVQRLSDDQILGIQIGSERGESAYYLLESIPKLYLTIIEATPDKLTYDNLEVFGGRSTIVNMEPEEAEGMYENNKFDFVFIETKLPYEKMKKLFNLYYPNIKSGGIIGGVDYNTEPVYDSVTDFRKKNKQTQPLHVIGTGRNWFWYK